MAQASERQAQGAAPEQKLRQHQRRLPLALAAQPAAGTLAAAQGSRPASGSGEPRSCWRKARASGASGAAAAAAAAAAPRLQTWRPGASWLLSDSAQPGKGSPGLQDSPRRVPQGLRSQESDDRSQGSYRAFAAEHGAAPPPPPASCLHTRRRPRGQQRRRREGGLGRELVMKTGQREGQGLPRWPPACPPPWPLWLELGLHTAGPVSLQPRKRCPQHGGHPLLPELSRSSEAEATAPASAPSPGPHRRRSQKPCTWGLRMLSARPHHCQGPGPQLRWHQRPGAGQPLVSPGQAGPGWGFSFLSSRWGFPDLGE